jgi:hypothetical protein
MPTTIIKGWRLYVPPSNNAFLSIGLHSSYSLYIVLIPAADLLRFIVRDVADLGEARRRYVMVTLLSEQCDGVVGNQKPQIYGPTRPICLKSNAQEDIYCLEKVSPLRL